MQTNIVLFKDPFPVLLTMVHNFDCAILQEKIGFYK